MGIESLARELIELQETSKRLLEADDVDAFINAIGPELRAAERLRSHLLSHPAAVTNDPAVKQLLKSIDLTEIDNPDKIGSELLFPWISPAEYAAGLAEVGVLVAPFEIPFDLRRFLDEARQCYALGQYAAVISLSRTILEAAVTDIAVRTGKMPQELGNKCMFKKYPPKSRIALVAGNRFDQIYDHYRELCRVVHGVATSASGGALCSLTKTIGFVQHLYEQHKEQIQQDNTAQKRK